MVIKRVGPLSCARIAGTLYAIIGLILGAIVSLISMAGGLASAAESIGGFRGPAIGAFMGTASIVLFPIFYGLMGFLTTLLGAWLYNMLAGTVGGIQVDVE
jgi:hypothetical protein